MSSPFNQLGLIRDRFSGTHPEFLTAAKNARDAGVAAWIFHTDAGYNLNQVRLFDGLDDVEQDVMNSLARELGMTA